MNRSITLTFLLVVSAAVLPVRHADEPLPALELSADRTVAHVGDEIELTEVVNGFGDWKYFGYLYRVSYVSFDSKEMEGRSSTTLPVGGGQSHPSAPPIVGLNHVARLMKFKCKKPGRYFVNAQWTIVGQGDPKHIVSNTVVVTVRQE